MNKEKRPVHPQEPAEGADEDVEAQGAQRLGDPSNPAVADDADAEKRSAPPDEPAEGEEVYADNA